MNTTASTPERIPLSPRDEKYRADAIEKAMSSAERFVADPERVPAGLRRPHSHHAFRKLPREQRRSIVLDNVIARIDTQQQAFLREVQAKREARERGTVQAPTAPEPATETARLVVPCAGGCGTMLPARSAKPVVKYCSPHGAQTATTRRRSPLDDSIREVVAKPSRSVSRPATPNKTKKHRRRAICAGTAAHA